MDIALQAVHSLAAETIDTASSAQHINLPTTQQWEGNSQDITAFEQALNTTGFSDGLSDDQIQMNQGAHLSGDTTESGASLSDDILQKMQSISSSAAEKGELLEQAITKATDTLNPMDIVKANRMMSEYYLENMMTAKLVGNATKAVERLTSLN